MQGDYLDRHGDLDSLDAVELAMALEEAGDPLDDDLDEDDASLVRNQPPRHPYGNAGASARLDED